MSAYIYVALTAGILLLLCLLGLYIFHQQKRKRMHALFHRFSESGSKNSLTFSGQEVLSDCILGLDGMHRKLLILKVQEGAVKDTVIDLAEVKTCSVKKQYGTINIDGLKHRKLDQYLQWMGLRFEFHKGRPAIEVPFYRHPTHSLYQLQSLEQKARFWETMLSKMLCTALQKRA